MAHEPFTAAEFDAVIGVIWNIPDDDPHRFSDLLADALGFIGAAAIDGEPRAAGLLRRMEQRALWGRDHEHEDHR